MSHRLSRREFGATLAGAAAGSLLFLQRPSAQAKPHRIDFHCHSAPPAWRAFLEANGAGSGGARWTPATHLAEMDRAGIATSLVSVASPGVWHGRDVARIR